MLRNDYSARIAELQSNARYRKREALHFIDPVRAQIGSESLLCFCANDYLGLSHHPEIKSAFKKGIDSYGVGSGASPLVTGYSDAHAELEEALASFLKRDRVLLVASGFSLNVGLQAALAESSQTIFQDKLCHASIIDGAQLSAAQLKRYKHLDISHLEALMTKCAQGDDLLVTDAVFSMDGDEAPLNGLVAMANRFHSLLIVDDAHGIGVLGSDGGGLLSELQLTQQDVPLLVGTFGKAFGVAGAFVAGPNDLIDWLVQRLRPLIYSTAMPPAQAVAILASLNIVSNDSLRRDRLHQRIAYFRQQMSGNDLTLLPSRTAIQPIVIGADADAVSAERFLRKRGLLVKAMRPPTVPEGSARLRITLSSEHSESHIDELMRSLVLWRRAN